MNYGARSVMNDVAHLALQKVAESQIRGDIREKCAAYSVCLRRIPDKNHANSWLVHLFINDAGNIEMAKEDPIGKLQYSVIIVILN